MYHIKKFEGFDLSQSKNNLEKLNYTYYSCDECDNIWESDDSCDCITGSII